QLKNKYRCAKKKRNNKREPANKRNQRFEFPLSIFRSLQAALVVVCVLIRKFYRCCCCARCLKRGYF
ncbi:hypothetical protein M5D96_007766, partial [Drosophila gunungcola]